MKWLVYVFTDKVFLDYLLNYMYHKMSRFVKQLCLRKVDNLALGILALKQKVCRTGRVKSENIVRKKRS